MGKMKYDDSWIGRRFNYFTIIGFGRQHRFVCRCDCGAVKEIISINVVSGQVKSCGCMREKLMRENIGTHHASGTRLYRIWSGMKCRCYIPSTESYPRYGGSGVAICDEWHYNFPKFQDWALSHGYTDDLTIDRIDPYGNYEPGNCRWIPVSQQGENRRENDDRNCKYRWIIDGVEHTATTWCEMYGLSYPMVMYRVKVKGMEPKDALTKPKHFMYRWGL